MTTLVRQTLHARLASSSLLVPFHQTHPRKVQCFFLNFSVNERRPSRSRLSTSTITWHFPVAVPRRKINSLLTRFLSAAFCRSANGHFWRCSHSYSLFVLFLALLILLTSLFCSHLSSLFCSHLSSGGLFFSLFYSQFLWCFTIVRCQ